jgi:hypothetical protein
MVNKSTIINKTDNHLSPQIIELKHGPTPLRTCICVITILGAKQNHFLLKKKKQQTIGILFFKFHPRFLLKTEISAYLYSIS